MTIADLLEENKKLEARARASESGKMKDRMERAKLESKLQNIQRLVDRIPPEVLAELKRQQRYTKEMWLIISKISRRPCAALYLDNWIRKAIYGKSGGIIYDTATFALALKIY